ncbi:MAG: SagB family peptide dehydrogenase [Gemmatimonadota bacterium]
MSSIIWRGRPGVVVRESESGVSVEYAGNRILLSRLTAGQAGALARLMNGGSTEQTLTDLVAGEGMPALAEWHWQVGMLGRLRAIEWVAMEGDRETGRLVPLGARFEPDFGGFDPTAGHRFSTYAFIRWDGAQWTIESPLAEARVEVPGGDPPVLAGSLLLLLHAGGMLAAGDEAAEAAGWSFHDALFHFRSRMGRRDDAWGARPDADPPVPLPRVVAYDPERRIGLAKPPLTPNGGPSFTEVLEGRRSRRRYGSSPIEADELGEFLFHVAADRVVADTVRRTYPSGGACYPLEIYAVIARGGGIPPGAYHYDPDGHALDPVVGAAESVDGLLRWYRGKAGDDEIQVLLLITLVPERVNRRYDAIGYSLALKEVGALFQSAYLVASAMGLSACALGGGDSDTAARTLGLDPLLEPVIGEFLIASGPA